jgi:hypothetical protein
MKINMSRTGIKISAEELKQFEHEIGYKLTESYRNFLLAYNGGEPEPYHFFIPSWHYNASLIQELKGIDSESVDLDLRKIHDIKKDILPEGFIIIGSDPGGNQILIGLAGENRGKIYFWDHEQQPDDRLPALEDYRNIHFVANSFEEFITSLKTYEEMGFD